MKKRELPQSTPELTIITDEEILGLPSYVQHVAPARRIASHAGEPVEAPTVISSHDAVPAAPASATRGASFSHSQATLADTAPPALALPTPPGRVVSRGSDPFGAATDLPLESLPPPALTRRIASHAGEPIAVEAPSDISPDGAIPAVPTSPRRGASLSHSRATLADIASRALPLPTPHRRVVSRGSDPFGAATDLPLGSLPPPAAARRLVSNGSTYSSGAEEADKKVQEPDWFNAYTRNTNEKDLLAEGISSVVEKAFADREKITILDVGCGNGDLVLKYLRPIITAGKQVEFHGIEKIADYREKFTSEEFSALPRLRVTTHNLDCFTTNLDDLGIVPDLILCSHVGYFGDIKALTENIMRLPGRPLVMFIHQSPHSLVNQFRESVRARVHTTVNQQIIEQLQSSVSITTEQKAQFFFHDLPSIVTVPAGYERRVTEVEWHRRAFHEAGDSQEAADLFSFTAQRTPKGLVKGHLLDDCTNIGKLMFNREILIWNRFVLFSKSAELISRARSHDIVFFKQPRIYQYSCIFLALREANLGIIQQMHRCDEHAFTRQKVGINPLMVLLVSASKQKASHTDIPDRFLETAEFISRRSPPHYLSEASTLANELGLHEFIPIMTPRTPTSPRSITSEPSEDGRVHDFASPSPAEFLLTLTLAFKHLNSLFTKRTSFAREARAHAFTTRDMSAIALFEKYQPEMVRPYTRTVSASPEPPSAIRLRTAGGHARFGSSTEGRVGYKRSASSREMGMPEVASPPNSHTAVEGRRRHEKRKRERYEYQGKDEMAR